MHTLRHYQVRLRRSRRLPYRLARLLLGVMLVLLLILFAYLVRRATLGVSDLTLILK
jgi:hypothetical protein